MKTWLTISVDVDTKIKLDQFCKETNRKASTYINSLINKSIQEGIKGDS